MVWSRVLSRPNPANPFLQSFSNHRLLHNLPPLGHPEPRGEISCLSFSGLRPVFSTACSLFSQNTGPSGISATAPRPLRLRVILCLRFCSASRTFLSTFRINTCKSVSKQTTLSSFRINTCEKTGGRGGTSRVSALRQFFILAKLNCHAILSALTSLSRGVYTRSP